MIIWITATGWGEEDGNPFSCRLAMPPAHNYSQQMTWQQFQRLFQHTLASQLGAGEATSLSRIVWEDAFGLQPGTGQLDEQQQLQVQQILARLRQQEPVQYILGKTQFFGLPFRLTPSVLIPRQETEELVAWVLEDAKGKQKLKVLDVGTGSGCIPIALKKHRPDLDVHALDVSLDALEIARENARLNEVKITFYEVDILDETEWQHLPDFDIILSNPPYIVEAERKLMPPQVLNHEPELALFTGNEDPLRFIRAIAKFAKQKLPPDGLLYFELNEFHASASAAAVEDAGFARPALRSDLNGKWRMLKAVRP